MTTRPYPNLLRTHDPSHRGVRYVTNITIADFITHPTSSTNRAQLKTVQQLAMLYGKSPHRAYPAQVAVPTSPIDPTIGLAVSYLELC